MAQLDPWRRLFHLAAAAGGVVTVGDVRTVGIAESTFNDRRHREHWVRLGRGVYLVPGVSVDVAARRSGALAACGEGAALSHATALLLHGLEAQAPSWGDPLHLTIPHDRWIRAPRGVSLHRSRCLDVRSVTEVHGLRTTTVARTVVDVAAELTASQVEGLTLHARQRDLLTAQALREQHERRPRLAGAGKVRQALDVLDTDGSDSILEARARRLLVDAGLVPSSAPHPVACVGETLMVDIAFPGRRLAVECDGRAFHSSPSAFERDRRRWRMLREAGWTIIWATWDRIHSQPVQFVTEVRRALQG